MPRNVSFENVSSVEPKKFSQLAGAFTASLSGFAVGTTLAWSSPATPMLLKGVAGFEVNPYENSVVSSMLAIGAAASSLPAGYVIDKIGRKGTIMGLVPFFLLGWALIVWGNTVDMLYTGRFILGMCSGVSCIAAPVFIAEISHKDIRGALGICFQLFLTGGILFTYIIGSQLDIFQLSYISALVPIVFGAAFFFFPETPVFFLTKRQPEKARKSLKFFRGSDYDCDAELCELARYSDKSNDLNGSTWDVFLSREGIKSLGMSVGMMIFQQLSGINAIIFYTTTIFEDSGSSIEPKYATIITGVIQFITTFLVVSVIERIGRVVLLSTSALLMSFSTFVLGLYFYLKDHDYQVTGFSWLPLLSMCVFLIVFSIGYGPVPWALIPEIIPSKIKGTATSVAIFSNWICAFFVTKFFSDTVATFGSGPTFWIFSAVTLVGTFFSYTLLPETKGKSFEEIQRKLRIRD